MQGIQDGLTLQDGVLWAHVLVLIVNILDTLVIGSQELVIRLDSLAHWVQQQIIAMVVVYRILWILRMSPSPSSTFVMS